MRLPEAKIKEAVVHPEKLVRQEALLYFADCYSRDAEVMPLAIKATEDHTGTAAWRYWPACGPGAFRPGPKSTAQKRSRPWPHCSASS